MLNICVQEPLTIRWPRPNALFEMFTTRDRRHSLFCGHLDELAVVVLCQPVDRLLTAGQSPEEQTAQTVGMANSIEDRQPRTRGRTPDVHGQGTQFLAKRIEIVGPYFVLGRGPIKCNFRCTAVAA